uniref:Secreted protein n=1 Tax=Haemonchus contortus TaxID=6289 RepID=A0A7I4Y018_HAECO
MMLLLFTVLLSAVYSEAGDCKASEIVVMNPGSLPPTIAGPLEKELKSVKVDLYDFEGTAAYYVGNVGAPDQYTAVCLSGKKLGSNVFCLKLSSKGTQKSTLDEFRSAYESCTDYDEKWKIENSAMKVKKLRESVLPK